MKRVSTATGLLTLVVMAVLGVFSAGAASAHEFVTTGPLPPLILVLSDNPQVFTPTPGEGAFQVSCPHFIGHGIGPEHSMTAKEQIITGTYDKCTTTGGNAAKITPIEYLITAEGTVSVLKPITITSPTALCSIKVFSSAENAANGKLEKLLILNNANGTILIHSDTTGIHSIGSGGTCGKAGEEKTEGTYFGLIHVWVHGGTIQWH